jgi:hypothetical protein
MDGIVLVYLIHLPFFFVIVKNLTSVSQVIVEICF